MSTFSQLVRHEIKFAVSPSFQKRPWFNWINILIALAIFAFTFVSIVSRLGANNLESYEHFYRIFYLFILLTLIGGISVIQIEFKQNTASWWLTLPYPRELLYRAKSFSLLLSYLYTCIPVYLIGKGALLAAITYTGTWVQFPLEDLFQDDWKFVLVSFLLTMLICSLTIFVTLLTRKRKSASTPIFLLLGAMLSLTVLNLFEKMIEQAAAGDMVSVPIYFWTGAPLLTILFYLLGVYVLKKHTDL